MSESESKLIRQVYAFQRTNACRLCAIILMLSEQGGVILRGAVLAKWAELYPTHALRTRPTIRGRVAEALRNIRAAGIVRVQEDLITVLDRDLLKMSAANLAIVQDGTGTSVAPSKWSSVPCVPDTLKAKQAKLASRGKS